VEQTAGETGAAAGGLAHTVGVTDVHLPPGWPPTVRPPGSPQWQRTAVAWLLDQCPHEYRAHPALVAQPVALAWLAARHVLAQGQANTAARGAARAELADHLDARALDGVLTALEHEHARLLAAHRAVGLVGDALRGLRYVPRL
jgi:HEAT repeat protein